MLNKELVLLSRRLWRRRICAFGRRHWRCGQNA